MFGVQWDLVLKYLETKGVTQSLLNSNSTSWGNYFDSIFDVTNSNAYYSSNNGKTYTQVGATTYQKEEYSNILLTTGANDTRNSKMNICDLAGNVYEWTLERDSNAGLRPGVFRGGEYYYGDAYGPASHRNRDDELRCAGTTTTPLASG